MAMPTRLAATKTRESIGDSLDDAEAVERKRVAGAAYSLFSTAM